MRGLLVLWVLTGCIEADLVRCADGLACPRGLVCDVAHHACTTQEHIDACTGLPDRTPCLTSSTCHDGVCLADACANDRLDANEACDDGNTTTGDGCAADCSSTEVCGNELVDVLLGETCDDGNLRSHDGCDSRCTQERPRWTPLRQIGPPLLHDHAAAYDERRGRLVVFGGAIPAGVSAQTLEWDDELDTWIELSPSLSPPGRRGAAMAYDARRGLVVMFGGNVGGNTVDDTWVWDGVHWREIQTQPSPSPRVGASMAYDSRRQRVVLYGGTTSATTWEWDGDGWTEIAQGGPGARVSSAMAYDPLRGNVVMYGGVNPSTQQQLTDGTWLWDGSVWTNVPDNGAAPRPASTMCFDPIRGGIVLVGDVELAALWDGTRWSFIGNMLTELRLRNPIVFYDPTRSTTRVQGGQHFTIGDRYETYELPANNVWQLVTWATPPATLEGAAMTYDRARGRIVRFGGASGGSGTNETWELVDSAWLRRTPTSSPSPRTAASMTYSSSHGGALLIVGDSSDPITWRWDGVAWSQVATNTPLRLRSGFAYSDAADQVVMLGGSPALTGSTTATWVLTDDTWEYTGTPTRSQHDGSAMTYDSARGVIVQFGGNALNETWEWDRTNGWVQRMPVRSPPHRVAHGAAYDPRRNATVVYSGRAIVSTTQFYNDTWSYDGTTWTRVDAEVRPPNPAQPALAYDEVHAQFIAFGHDTWRLQWDSQLANETCIVGSDRDGDGLAGCADPDCLAYCERCGDGVCQPIETCRACPDDCGTCLARCGDAFCDPPETAQSCPGDCP